MYPCQDGGSDDFSAYAGYSGTDSTTEMYAPVDSRLITNEIDLTGYSSAFIEFTEAYTYPEDANDSNMVEVSIDGGVTWDWVSTSEPISDYARTLPYDLGNNYTVQIVEIHPLKYGYHYSNQ